MPKCSNFLAFYAVLIVFQNVSVGMSTYRAERQNNYLPSVLFHKDTGSFVERQSLKLSNISKNVKIPFFNFLYKFRSISATLDP